VKDGRIQVQEDTDEFGDAAVDVGVARAAAVAVCLDYAGTLPTRAAWLLQWNLVSVYKSRNTKTPSLDGAFQLRT
jgi:hypothetical protein